MATSNFDGSLHVAGTLTAHTLVVPSSTITNAMVANSAELDATKLEHQYQIVYAQEYATNATAARRLVHVGYGAAGTIVAFKVGAGVAATGNADADVNLLKNGTSVLASGTAVNLTSATSAYATVSASVTTTTIAAGDVLEITAAVDAGTGALATGLFAVIVLREDAA